LDPYLIEDFRQASKAFADLVGRVGPSDWELPGLGVWSVRDLVGHTSRALLSVEECLSAPPRSLSASVEVTLTGAAEYFALAGGADHDAIAERGREAGAALGEIPSTAVAVIRTRALMALQRAVGSGEDPVVSTRFGGIYLSAYLPTRTFELVVHTLDLGAALGVDAEMPAAPLATAAHLATDLALGSGRGPGVLLALTGRAPR
jgi:uncharacterized protein (TIGR03083 family)